MRLGGSRCLDWGLGSTAGGIYDCKLNSAKGVVILSGLCDEVTWNEGFIEKKEYYVMSRGALLSPKSLPSGKPHPIQGRAGLV
jgi:hypothetical protein